MPETTATPKRVAVLRFSAVGDIVLTTPALAALKHAWPDAEIIYVTKAALAPLIAHSPHVARVLTLAPGEGVLSLRRRLAALAPDAILDLHGKMRGAVLRTLVPRTHRVLWNKRPLGQELGVRLLRRPYRAEMHIAARYHRAVEKLVGRPLAREALRLDLAPGANDRARTRLLNAGVDLSRPLVGMSPGAMWYTKRWPLERYMALAQRAAAGGCEIVLTGSSSEAADTRAIAQAVPAAVDFAGALDIGELGAVIAQCRVFVANDSGPMHMARALGVPTVAFFGSTDPAQFDFEGHALMYAGVPCAPCSLYGLARCPRRHFRCMLDLEVDSAWQALERLLAKSHHTPHLTG